MKKIIISSILAFIISNNAFSQCEPALRYEDSALTAFFIDTSGVQWVSYMWDFGDGSTATTPNPNHTYPDTGLYVACFTGIDGNGCSGTQCLNVGIGVPSLNLRLLLFGYYDCSPPMNSVFMFYTTAMRFGSNPSLSCYINFGDGTDTTFINSGTQVQINHTYSNAGTYIINSVITGPNNTTASYTSLPIIVASTCGPVSGIVYNDLNSNCTFDPGEEISGVPLQIFNGTQFLANAVSDSLGQYSFEVPSGNSYDIRVFASNGISSHYAPSCPASGLLTVNVPSSGNDFGLTCPPSFDITGTVTSSLPRPGFMSEVCISAYNRWCNTPNGQIVVQFDPDVTPLPDTSGIGYQVSGNTVTYPINSNEYYWSFCVPALVSLNAQIGDSVCYDFDIQPVTGDSVPGNNAGQACFMVRNSFDPNDKAVTPAGEGIQGYIRPGTDLTYKIRFQNTGTADAVHIYILDTLSVNLDVTTVEVIGASHNMTWLVLTGNILRFSFNNIHLPDSNANEPVSHGYVIYRIKQVSNIAHMSTINNSAAIYFDFNSPIITNSTVNTIDFFLDVNETQAGNSILVFPNPADDYCNITFDYPGIRKILVKDITGREIYFSEMPLNTHTLNTGILSNGVYIVKIFNNNFDSNTLRLVVQH